MLAFSGMQRPPLSVTIITLNEQSNLARALQSVRWTDEVVVIDSGSTDRTIEIAKAFGARVIQNPWPGYGQQKNFAQAQATHDWILNLDADEEVPAELALEIQQRLNDVGEGRSKAVGFSFPRKTYYLGQWIRYGGWYPNVLVRIGNRKACRWSEPNVHEELMADGEIHRLKNALNHFAFPSIQEQVLTNLRFSRLGSEDLKRKGQTANLVRLILKPIGKFIETFLIKRGFLDGMAGFIISINAAHSIFLKYAYLFEPKILKLSEKSHADPDHR